MPADDPERNDRQAREALLDALDLDPARVHPMGAPGGPDGDDADAAAARYADELLAAAPPDADVPPFDVLLLGHGPEGHTASIFPESPAAHDERAAFAVHGCPKPPPTRVSLGFSAITRRPRGVGRGGRRGEGADGRAGAVRRRAGAGAGRRRGRHPPDAVAARRGGRLPSCPADLRRR